MANTNNVPTEIREAAISYERRFGLDFSHYYLFPKSLLAHLHADRQPREDGRAIVASYQEKRIHEIFSVLSRVANTPQHTPELCRSYLEGLLEVYGFLPRKPTGGNDVLTVAPEREGRILAERKGWFIGHVVGPHVKRIPFRSGLVVGLENFPSGTNYERCNIIDGAIASGATLICILDSLKEHVKRFSIYSVHATFQGLRALFRYSDMNELETSISVGHATDGLNHKYYAIVPDQPSLVQVGDLGDTIDFVL